MRSNEFIHDRGRGPEIKGTRITVYDILDYLLMAWHSTRIALFLHVSSRQVDAAIKYIQQHKLELISEYHQMLQREGAGNPPELQARLDASRGKARALARELRKKANSEYADERPRS